MDFILNKAIALGLNPVRAIQMATANVAEHFHLDDLGGIAPGKCADLVVIPDLNTIKAKLVICRGKVVARDGEMTVELPEEHYHRDCLTSLGIPRVGPEFFHVPVERREVTVRAIEMVTDIVNRETALNLPVVDGRVNIHGMDDVLKVAVIDRSEPMGRRTVGFMRGFGLRRGALGSSSSFDEGNLVVIGSDDEDMAAVVNRIGELNGGLVYSRDGQVVEELPLPIFGTISNLPGSEVATRMDSLTSLLQEMGCKGENPLLTLLTTTFTAIPSLRLTVKGYWLSKESRIVSLFV